MKNKSKKYLTSLLMMIVLCLSLPFTMLLSGCGATPTNDANAVHFESDKYDSDGKAIFEVDLNVPKYLNFKVNPSSWSGYTVNYSNDATAENRRYFELIDGTIKVIDMRFRQIVVEISINDHKDYCVVKLKEYPTKIYVENTDVTLAAQGALSIDPIAEFTLSDGSKVTKHVTETDFKFRVESSDVTKVHVPDSSRLKVYAVSSNPASAKVKVSLLDESGNVKLSFEININVVPSADRAVLKISGQEKFVPEGGSVEVLASNIVSDTYNLKYDIYFFSSSGVLVGENSQVTCSFSDTTYVSADLDNNLIKIGKGIRVGTEINVKMFAEVIDDSGLPFTISFKIVIK